MHLEPESSNTTGADTITGALPTEPIDRFLHIHTERTPGHFSSCIWIRGNNVMNARTM